MTWMQGLEKAVRLAIETVSSWLSPSLTMISRGDCWSADVTAVSMKAASLQVGMMIDSVRVIRMAGSSWGTLVTRRVNRM